MGEKFILNTVPVITDSCGEPLRCGEIRFVEHGTNNPIPIYGDECMQVPTTNPRPLNQYGSFDDIYVPSGVAFDVQIYNDCGCLVDTISDARTTPLVAPIFVNQSELRAYCGCAPYAVLSEPGGCPMRYRRIDTDPLPAEDLPQVIVGTCFAWERCEFNAEDLDVSEIFDQTCENAESVDPEDPLTGDENLLYCENGDLKKRPLIPAIFENICANATLKDIEDPLTGNENVLYCEDGDLNKRPFSETVSEIVLELFTDDEFADSVFNLLGLSADSQIVAGRDYWVTIPNGPGPVLGDGDNYGADFHVLGAWVDTTDPLYVPGGPWVLEEISTAKSGRYHVMTRAHVRPKNGGDTIQDINFAYAFYRDDGTLKDVYPSENRVSNANFTEPNIYDFGRLENCEVGERVVPLIYATTALNGPIEVRYVRHSFHKILA